MHDGLPDSGVTGYRRSFLDGAHLRVAADAVAQEGLRERKKRLTRQLISDVATQLFLERGFEEVRVAEVAAACGVSEKTVYNYFPTKEALVLDREEAMAAAIVRALGEGGAPISPIESAVAVIAEEMSGIYDRWGEDPGAPVDLGMIRRFIDLFEETPALRAAQGDMMERLVEVAARAMAARAGVDPDDPEPQIAAHAIIGLWRVEFRAMRRYSDGSLPPAEVRDRVLAEVRRAARLIDTGLWSFGLVVQGGTGRDQIRAAARSANEARAQVLSAIRQAKEAWRQVASEVNRHHTERDHSERDRTGRRPPEHRRRR